MHIRAVLYPLACFFILCLTFMVGLFFFVVNNHCVDFSVLARYKAGTPSILLDDNGQEWARFQLDRRDPIPYDKMPKHLINAFVAAEDWAFFSHNGLSWRGIIRSTLVNVYHGRKVQGASTITQQLVRLLFFDSTKTFKRKIKEQLYALLVEQQFTKEQIMETYLNHVYLGCGIYGVQAAAQRFWNKQANELTIDEAATLAATVQRPEYFCPLTYPLSAQKRRNLVLHNMHKLNFITTSEFEKAKAQSVACLPIDNFLQAPHAKEAIRLFLEQLVGKEALYTQGLVIQTTINSTIQKRAQDAFAQQMNELKKTVNPEIDGALISLDVKTGAIKALIGGYDFKVSKFNRALDAKRQMGSVFKTLVYATAMQQGRSFADTEIDEPIQVLYGNNLWEPQNWNHEFAGQITLAYALSRSTNTVAIKTLLQVGIDRVIALANRCHLTGPFNPYPSLALGCVDEKLKEVAGMFNIFANHGTYVEPHLVSWIKDRFGKRIWRAEVSKEYVIHPRISDQVTKVLSIGMERIRKNWYQGNWLSCQAISKTGTTDDARTCWWAGSSPALTTVIYVGRDDNKPLGKNVYPITTAFPIWKELYSAISHPQAEFSYDPHLKEVIIDERTGATLSDSNQENAITILV